MARFNRHITRNFNANKTNRIRYDEDDFRCEILAFDKTFEQTYTPYTIKEEMVSNGEWGWFQGMKCIQSKYYKGEGIKMSSQLQIIVYYDAKETSSNYRLELLFANRHKTGKNEEYNGKLQPQIHLEIENKKINDEMTPIGTDVNFSRYYHYCKMERGRNQIVYTLSPNTIFLGLVVKKYNRWEASRHNGSNDYLTMIKATVEHTKDLAVNTMTAEFMYHHQLDEKLLPTDPMANRSGLVFDYRDEINLYVYDTDGNKKQVFGGYISTVEVDDDLTTVTMECADRLIDLDRRYCLSEVTINGGNSNEDIVYKGYYDYKKNYNNYSDPLKFLMNNSEVYLDTNIAFGKPLVENKSWKLAKYRKKGYNKFTAKNMKVQLNESSITLRNGADTLEPQSLVIFDSDKIKSNIELNTYPNLFMHYGLGVEKWEEKGVEYSTVNVQSNPTKTQKKWIDRLHTITKRTDEQGIKAVWKKVAHFNQDPRSDFFQSADKTWDTKNGNCCCKTECMLNLLNAMGIQDLKYVHMKKGKGGHVFAKVNGYYVDPSSKYESNGWKNHITYPKGAKIIKVTDYPNKPFGN